MATIARFDSLPGLAAAKRTRSGTLRVQGFATRVGVFTYKNKDGSLRRELRLPEEVFRLDSLDSLMLVPVTLGHPPEGILGDHADPKLVAKHSAGSVSGPAPHGDAVKVDISLIREDAIAAAEAGIRELSCGYTLQSLEQTPGVWRGQPYDVIQRGITYDHLALVPMGRAGEGAHIRLDALEKLDDASWSCDDEMVPPQEDAPKAQKERKMAKIRLDAANEIEVDDAVAPAIANLKARLDAITEERDVLKAKAAPEAITKAVLSRAKLLSQAKDVMGADAARLDSETDETVIRRAVLGKLGTKADISNESAVMVQARFDVAMEAREDAVASHKEVAQAINSSASTARTDAVTVDPVELARLAMIASNRVTFKA